MRFTTTIATILVLVIGGFVLWGRSRSFPLPSGKPASVGSVAVSAPNATAIAPTSARSVAVSDGVRHSIPLDAIIDGGPGKDGIPAIDQPHFESVTDADRYLQPQGLGISIITERTQRFYPFQIIVWHEIVNDTVDGVPIAVTYCPLCGTGFTFDRRVGDTIYEFGVSGKLYQNNLLMFDRATETLWQQQIGEAVVGELVGARLQIFPSENIRWGDWKRLYPDGEVLSRDTGVRRDYTEDPYAGYANDPSPGLFPGTPLDPRLPAKAMVVGIVVGDTAKAYAWDAVRRERTINDTVGGLPIVVFVDPASGAISMRKRPTDGPVTDARAAAALPDRPEFTTSFWFSWAAFHPMTKLMQ